MPEDALEELENMDEVTGQRRKVLELKLAAMMLQEDWENGAVVARELCGLAVDEPDFFLHAAFCTHESGDTEEAKKWLLSGPDSLQEFPVYHYNMACYLWTLGEKERARNHLSKAVEMDGSFLDVAKDDKDLVGMNL